MAIYLFFTFFILIYLFSSLHKICFLFMVCACVCVCQGQRSVSEVLCCCSPPYFLRQASYLPWNSLIRPHCLDIQVLGSSSSIFHKDCRLGLQQMLFYMGVRYLNSGPHAFTASASCAEPSPQPCIYSF